MFLKLWALLLSNAGQIPSSETVNYDAVLSTTLRAYRKKLADNITRGNKFVSYLKEKGRFSKQSGGYNVHVPLMHAQNSTADIYSGYGVLDTTPQDGITAAFYNWSQLSVSITISNLEKKQNKGEAKILDLLKSKTTQAEVSLKQLLNNCIVAGRITGTSTSEIQRARIGRLDSGATGPLPIGAFIDLTPGSTSVSVGNINASTYSFWKNQAVSASGLTTFVGYKNAMNQTFNSCAKGTGGVPDLLLGDQTAWEEYWLSLTQNERYLINDKKTVDILGGSDALAFRQSMFMWDEVVGDPYTPYNVVDGVGTPGVQNGGSATASTIYFINSDTFEFIVESDTDFDTTDFVRPENQDAVTAQILWMGATGVNNRRKNGVLYRIAQNIVS